MLAGFFTTASSLIRPWQLVQVRSAQPGLGHVQSECTLQKFREAAIARMLRVVSEYTLGRF